MQPRLTDPAALARNRRRARPEALFLFDAARDELQDRLSLVNRRFTAPAVVTGQPQVWDMALPARGLSPTARHWRSRRRRMTLCCTATRCIGRMIRWAS